MLIMLFITWGHAVVNTINCYDLQTKRAFKKVWINLDVFVKCKADIDIHLI